MSTAKELLAQCAALGVRLIPEGGSGLQIDFPNSGLPPGLIDSLACHKLQILALLAGAVPASSSPGSAAQAGTSTHVICRCGSSEWIDTPIHNGQSLRRDCARCGRHIGFPWWYGKACIMCIDPVRPRRSIPDFDKAFDEAERMFEAPLGHRHRLSNWGTSDPLAAPRTRANRSARVGNPGFG
jgi:hypothetical protein